MTDNWLWIIFAAVIVLALVLDLGVLNRHSKEVRTRVALTWVAVWVSLASGFCVLLWQLHGSETALAYLTAYIIEYSLSVDNIFVFVVIFGYFDVAPEYQHRTLFWGIIGAVVLRAIMIFAGIALVTKLHWVLYLFGAFLIFTGIKLLVLKDEKLEPERNPFIKLVRKLFPVSKEFVGEQFFARIDGKLFATPLFVVLVLIETTDVVFALDSIPAAIGISQDPLVIYTSNIFAILGLRSLYFVLARAVKKFHLLKFGIAFILAFIGAKMLLEHWVVIPVAVSLAVVAGVLMLAVVVSLLVKPQVVPEQDNQTDP